MDLDFALSRGDLDSATELRDTIDVHTLLREEGGRLIFARNPAQFAMADRALWSREATEEDGVRWWEDIPPSALWFMGRDKAGLAQIVVSVSQWGRMPLERDTPGNGTEDLKWENLLDFVPTLRDPMDSLIATQASALMAWHDVTRFCHACGNPLEVQSAGWTLKCTQCGHSEYPRTDPAVIVAVVDTSDRLLLVHNVLWPATRMSLLAGYVDAGEDLARTVRREVLEEVGLEVTGIQYLGSQPWPRPRSLMLAYKASVAEGVAPRADQVEVDRACFFTREQLVEQIGRGDVVIPQPAAVAHTVINLWLEGKL